MPNVPELSVRAARGERCLAGVARQQRQGQIGGGHHSQGRDRHLGGARDGPAPAGAGPRAGGGRGAVRVSGERRSRRGSDSGGTGGAVVCDAVGGMAQAPRGWSAGESSEDQPDFHVFPVAAPYYRIVVYSRGWSRRRG
jgi:hypothetical protein